MGTRDFNGTTDLINCASGSTIDDIWGATNGGTFFGWIFPDTIGEANVGGITAKGNGGTVGWLFNLAVTTKISLNSYRATTDGQWTQTNDDLVLDAWNSVSLLYDSALTTNDPTLVHNGTIQTVGSGLTEAATPVGAQGSDAALNMFIGNFTASATATFDGYICECAYWKGYAMSTVRLQALSRGVNPLFVSETKPSAYLPIWGNDSPEFDLSGNNNDGTLTGTTAVAAHGATQHMSNYISGFC